VILIDSCSGNHKPRPEMARYEMLNTRYLDNLKTAGVQSEEIDFVLCAQLHVDHVGWDTQIENGRWVPTFRTAKQYHVTLGARLLVRESARPFHHAEFKKCLQRQLPVVENDLTIMFDNGYSLDDCLTVVPARGHTPGHVRIDLRSKEQSAVFCGDVLHNPVQVPLWHWNTVICDNPTQAKQSRHDVLSLCAESGALLMPMHFGQPHAALIKSKYGTFSVDFNNR
jgi:glyoxylase-like metal-dependent hydrolase (beta-lactamase superfamily II)